MENKERNKNFRKPRSRQNTSQSSRFAIIDSRGPDRKSKGTASQLFDRYTALARESEKDGNHQEAENFFQHAEHYRRLNPSFKGESDGEKKECKEAEDSQYMMILPPKKFEPSED